MPPRSLPTKKRKLQTDSDSDSDSVSRSQPNTTKPTSSIQDLESTLTQALSTNTSLNPLADLLNLTCSALDPQDTSRGIYALYRVFVLLISGGRFSPTVLVEEDSGKVVKAWLWERLNEYVTFLGGLLKDHEKYLRISALQILFSLQKHLSTSASTPTQKFHIAHFRKIVSFLLLCPPSTRGRKKTTPAASLPDGKIDVDVVHSFHETWFSVHDDIRWFFLREAAYDLLLANSKSSETHIDPYVNVLTILERLNTFPTEKEELNSWWVAEMGTKPPKTRSASRKHRSPGDPSSSDEEDDTKQDNDDDDDWRKFFDDEPVTSVGAQRATGVRLHKLTIHQSVHSLASHRAVFTRAWIALLPRLSLEAGSAAGRGLTIRALNVMHRGVLPHLTRPVLVMDWVGGCVDVGGLVGLLALNALFILMKEYNLDYPSFYTRLYAFSTHRARFFRMMELFLSSTHLPATLLASFVKRLARLTLTAPPAAIIMAVPFTYNVLKRHPALMVMIHRPDCEDPSLDPFLASEPNPLLTNALSSSLWELTTHRLHYHSGVSTLVKIFSEAFTKPGYAMEDFLDHTYTTLFETDAKRKIKKEPAMAIVDGRGIDVVEELWML
ncbi:CBF/Mak21 family-domain-containing protein [Infundibulicybe gibba]|nr:CBF/Mak21 family-domain-containing protein [Infundibulicybe gibba]